MPRTTAAVLAPGTMSTEAEDYVAAANQDWPAGTRGRGVAPRALGAVADWGIANLGLHRLELEHSTLNEPSCRVAEKAGFQLEGTRRSVALHDDGWHDMHVHVLFALVDPGPGDLAVDR